MTLMFSSSSSTTHDFLVFTSTSHRDIKTSCTDDVTSDDATRPRLLTEATIMELATTAATTTTTAEAHLSSGEEEAFQVVHTVLTVAALFTNCLSLFVIYGIVPQLTSPLRLLTSLAFAQMLAPWAVMTIYFSRSTCQDEIHASVLLAAHNAVAMTLFCHALSHVVACFRPFHYVKLVSSRRVWTAVGVVWALSLLLAHVHFFVGLSEAGRGGGGVWRGEASKQQRGGYCDVVAGHTWIALGISFLLALLVTVLGLLIYWRITIFLQPVQPFIVECQNNDKNKGVITGVVLLFGYFAAWLPFLVVRGIVAWRGADTRATLVITGVCQAAILFNCFIDPIIYGRRKDQVKGGYLILAQLIRNRVSGAWRKFQQWLRCGTDDVIPTTPLTQIDYISC